MTRLARIASGPLRPPIPPFSAIAIISGAVSEIDTLSLFDSNHIERLISPLDQFLENANELNRIYLNAEPLGRILGNLVFLGYVSAVESYVRAVIRRLLNIDEVSRRRAEPETVSFGAAVAYSSTLLPDALIEPYSLADPDNVTNTVKKFTGITLPPSLKQISIEFRKLCQLRHCCTHRFGRLGTTNAIKLGLEAHRELLDKPLALDKADLDIVADSLRTFVKALNNALFEAILKRTVTHTVQQKILRRCGAEDHELYREEWCWDYRRDRRRFLRYYELFCTTLDTVPSPPSGEVYRRFRKEHKH
jgi:hypothetical protein